MTDLQRWTPTGIDTVDRAVATWRPTTMVPAQYLDKQGHVKLADLQLAGMWLYALDVPPTPNLPQVYIIHGRVGIMAELQRALIARAGYDLEIVETTAERAVVRIRRHPDSWKPDVVVTWADAVRAGWTTSPNYQKIPDRMLAARACTKAISLYAPGALTGVVAPANNIAQLEPAGEAPGEVANPAGPSIPARSIAPDGSTIPEHLREPEVDEPVRAWLIERVDTLTETDRDTLAAIVHPIQVPNLRSHRFTQAHAMLLDRLLNEISGPVSPRPSAVDAAAHPPAAAPTGPDQPPTHLYDNMPEARGYDDDLQPASYEDPDGAPF